MSTLSAPAPLPPAINACRTAQRLDGVWSYARDTGELSQRSGFAAEKRVAVPGSVNDLFVEEELRSHAGAIWLGRSFFVPPGEERRWTLHFGAGAMQTEVFVNGRPAGAHAGWATPFAVNITPLVSTDAENLLTVRLENRFSADTVPQGNLSAAQGENGQIAGQYPDVPFDFYPYLGLHRSVTLCSTSGRAWIEELELSPFADLASGTARLQVRVRSGATAEAVRVALPELNLEWRVDGRDSWSFEVELGRVEWWSPARPRLYRCVLTLEGRDRQTLDVYERRIGVRHLEVRADGLWLNGECIVLRGFGCHEDFAILGKGHNDAVMIRDFELLRWMGANSFRTTHYPYAEEVLDHADEAGVLVISECAAVSLNFDRVTAATLAAHVRALRELVTRDRHHPSVIAWSLGNEGNSDRPAAKPHFEHVAKIVRELDPYRPITYVSCWPEREQAFGVCDFVSVNLYPGWYYLPGRIEAAAENIERVLREMHARYGKPILVSEFGADAMAGLHSLPAEQWTEDYQADLLVALSRRMAAMPFVLGQHVWNLADFRTAQHHFRANGNKKGVFTRDRQPKLAARWLRAEWTRQIAER